MQSTLKAFQRRWRSVLITAPAVTGLAIALKFTGLFQLLEWAALDQFFRLRPQEPVEERILIVTVDETDINYLGKWPISDATLAQLVKTLARYQPAAIGLNFYRDLPVQPGHQDWVQVMKTTPNLIGVEKIIGEKVPPPPILSQKGQVGFADLLLDPDGKIRRVLISDRNAEGQVHLSLAAQLALIYLKKKNITLERIENTNYHLRLGQAVFVPLTGNEGGYVRANAGGYQIFLNYRGQRDRFRTISLTEVLENKIDPEWIKDRIILIGAVAPSLNELFSTPYSSQQSSTPKLTSGIIIHANIISQILSAAQEGRPMMQALPQSLEWLWIFSWAFIGAAVIWQSQTAKAKSKVFPKWVIGSVGTLLSGNILIASSFIAFLKGWWIPIIPSLIALCGSAIVITSYRAVKLQRDTYKRLTQFLDAMPVGVCVLDASGQFYYTNRKAEQILGQKTVSQVTSERLTKVHPFYRAGTKQLYPLDELPPIRALAGEQITVDDLEIHQNNKIVPIEGWATPIFDENDNIVYALLAFQDITERKKAEAERERLIDKLSETNRNLEETQQQRLDLAIQQAVLEQAKLKAEIASQAKSEFLANMSHELRTPLNAVLGYAQLLQRDMNATPKQKEGLSIIYQCGSHLLTLINDILDFSKIEAGKMELVANSFHLAEFLREVVDMFRWKAEQKGIAFSYQIRGSLPVAIEADEKRLRQVLINLLSNAIKFTDRGSVTFTVEGLGAGDWQVEGQRREGEWRSGRIINHPLPTTDYPLSTPKIRFAIEDTGIGMTLEELEKIFLPFEQVGERSRQREGTGLGLTISRQIAQMMGSEIQVESTLGVGSKFWLDLELSPAKDGIPLATAKSDGNIVGYEGEKQKILVVDDRWENRTILMNFLSPLGFEVMEANHGKEGILKAWEFQPHLIIIDLIMPVMDGLAMMRSLRKLPQFEETILIACSASKLAFENQENQDRNFDDFLLKPISLETILGKIQKHLAIKWIYENPAQCEQELTLASTVAISPLTPIVAPPSESLTALYEAAQVGNVEKVKREVIRIQDLSSEYHPFVDKILDLAHKFEDEAILEFVKSYLTQ